MRADPLSNSTVISLLNQYFVPVYAVNEDYAPDGPIAAEAKAERDRIFKEGYGANLSVGTVHVYILDPAGKVIDSMHVAKAAKTENLIAMLEKTVRKLKTALGEAVIKPQPQARHPACDRECIVLHLVARSVDGRGACSDFPVENWIVLSGEEQKRLMPRAHLTNGASWRLDRAIAEKILTHFYPATENNDVSKNRFDQLDLQAVVVSASDRTMTARLHGHFRMQHSFYHKEDGKIAEGQVIGFIQLDRVNGSLKSLRMTTKEAAYGGGKFAIALRSAE